MYKGSVMVNTRDKKKVLAAPSERNGEDGHVNEPGMEGVGTKPCSLEGHVKEFCLYPKITGYSIKFQMQYVAKRNCLHLGLWFLLLYFLFFSWMMSSIHNLKQKHGNFHLLPHSVGHYGQSILPPIYASNVCHFYHCCLIQTSFFSYLHH